MMEQVEAILEELRQLRDPRILEVNARHGDDHAVNLTKLRAVAKRIGTDQELARALWATDVTEAKLLTTLIGRVREFSPAELDTMLRTARTPKVHDWLVANVVKKSRHAEQLRVEWLRDPDPVVASAGWALTSERVTKQPAGLDLEALVDTIEAELKDAPERLQWAMNTCLGNIGIEHAQHRERVVAIGERLGVLADYPVSPGCVSPYVPIWVSTMVARQDT